MAIDQDVLNELTSGGENEPPKKHIITFSHEEWLELAKGFGGIDQPQVFKTLLMKLGRHELKVTKPMVAA